MSEHVNKSESNGIVTFTFSRVAKKNAITLAMYDELTAMLREVGEREDTRVVILRGDGGIFTAGNDLEDFWQAPPQSLDSPVGRFLFTISEFALPIVAAVEGAAIGIGTTMLLHCDLIYATAGTRFALPFVPLGLCPEGGSSYLLPRLCGHARASELLLLGETFDALTARDIGLVNEVLPDANALHARVEERARALAARPAAAIRVTKQLLREGMKATVRDTLLREGDHFFERLRSPEARAAMEGFLRRTKS